MGELTSHQQDAASPPAVIRSFVDATLREFVQPCGSYDIEFRGMPADLDDAAAWIASIVLEKGIGPAEVPLIGEALQEALSLKVHSAPTVYEGLYEWPGGNGPIEMQVTCPYAAATISFAEQTFRAVLSQTETSPMESCPTK